MMTHVCLSYLKQKVIFEDPLHRDHQEILKLELALLDLHGTLLWWRINAIGKRFVKLSTCNTTKVRISKQKILEFSIRRL